MFRDVLFIASRLGFQGALWTGLISFIIFFCLVPAWLHGIQPGPSNPTDPLSVMMANVTDQLIDRRFVRGFKWVGIASAVGCVIIAIRNYFYPWQMTNQELRQTNWLAKIITRIIG